jgi:hypothetical protein
MARGRASGAEHAERVNAAADLLASGLPPAAAAHALARRFSVSARQARRYADQAAACGPAPVPEPTVVFTVKLPASLAARAREHAREAGLAVSAVAARALAELLDRDRGKRPGR